MPPPHSPAPLPPEARSWILHFILRQPIVLPSTLLSRLLTILLDPSDPNPPRELILVLRLMSDLSNRTISSRTVFSLELLHSLRRARGIPPSVSLRSAYAAAAAHCTLAPLRAPLGGPEALLGFHRTVDLIWNSRIADMERSRFADLSSGKLMRWRSDIEIAVEDPEVRGRLAALNTLDEALHSINEFVREVVEEMGPSFLEIKAKEYLDFKGSGTVQVGNGDPLGIPRVFPEGQGCCEPVVETSEQQGKVMPEDRGVLEVCRGVVAELSVEAERPAIDAFRCAKAGTAQVGNRDPFRIPRVLSEDLEDREPVVEVSECGEKVFPKDQEVLEAHLGVAGLFAEAQTPAVEELKNAVEERLIADEIELAEASCMGLNASTSSLDRARARRALEEGSASAPADIQLVISPDRKKNSFSFDCGCHSSGDDDLSTPRVNEIKDALKANCRNLLAAVEDPLPAAVVKAADVLVSLTKIASELKELQCQKTSARESIAKPSPLIACNHMFRTAEVLQTLNDGARSRPGLMERNPTAHTYEWEDDFINSTDESTDDSKRIRLSSLRKRKASPLELHVVPKFTTRRKVQKWSLDEERILRESVEKYGKGKWKLILDCHPSTFLERRPVDLKDKWRNMNRHN